MNNKKMLISVVLHLDPELYIRIATSGGHAETKTLDKLSIDIQNAHNSEEEEIISSIAEDEIYYRDETSRWSRILALIALYHKIEVIRSRALNIAKGETNDYHNINAYNAALDSFDISHASVAEYSEIDELRILVNNFKHSGENVGDRLSTAFPSKYTKEQKIEIKLSDVFAFSEAADAHIRDLSKKIRQQLTRIENENGA